MRSKYVLLSVIIVASAVLISGCRLVAADDQARPTNPPTAEPTQAPIHREPAMTPTAPPQMDSGGTVQGWTGTIVDLPAGNQFGQEFVREDGQSFYLGTPTDAVGEQVVEARSTGAEVRVWGTLYTSPSEGEAQTIVLDRVEILSQSNGEGELVEGWTGTIVDLPAGNQFGQEFVRQDGQSFYLGTPTDAVREQVVEALSTGAEVRIWGTLCTSPSEGEAQTIVLDRVEILYQSNGEGEPVEGWTGTIVDLPAGNQFGQEFVRQDGQPFYLGTPTDAVREQVVEARSTGAEVRVWGTIYTSPSEGEAQTIVLDRVEILSQSNGGGEPVEGWTGTIYKCPPGNQFGQTFVRDDGERYDVGASDEALRATIADAAWTGAHIRVDGWLYVGVPTGEARHIEVEELDVLSPAACEPRDLTPFSAVSASSFLPADQYGGYSPYAAVDGARDTSWVEGSAGPGVGEWIELSFPDALQLHMLALDVGFDASADLFEKNNRVKRATVLFSTGEQTSIEFDDARGFQEFAMVRAPGPNVETTSIRVIIDEVYPGTKYDDTCLAEIQVWGVVP